MQRKRLLFLFFVLLICKGVWAYDFVLDGLCYNIKSTTGLYGRGTVELVGYTSAMEELEIPCLVRNNNKEYFVYDIKDYAFQNCNTIKSVYFSCVQNVGEYSFANCISLETIHFSNSITYIRAKAFHGCVALTEIYIEDQKPPTISDDTFDENTYNNACLVVPKGSKSTYQTTTYWANFKKIVESGDETTTNYSLFITSSGNGYLTYDGITVNNTTTSFTVNEGTSAILTLTSNSGYKIGSLKVNGNDVTSSVSNNVYTIENIDKDTSVEVIFEADIPYLDIEKFITVYNTGGSFMQTNDLLNSGSQLNWAFYNNSSVDVTLKSLQLIDGKTGSEGNIMSVDQLVEAGSSVAYTTTIGALGIHIPVICRFRYDYNGKEYFVDATYKDTYSLTIECSGKGSANYNSTIVRDQTSDFEVRKGNSVTISFTPDEGYRVKTLKVNDVDVTSKITNNQYTIGYFINNTNISVTFETIPTYTLGITSTGGGYVTYSGSTIKETTKSFTVNEGTSATLTFIPNSGYKIESLKVNGEDITSNVVDNKYTINSIDGNTNVSVVFKLITYSLDITSSGGGYVTCANTTINGTTKSFTYDEGASAILTFTPNSGYRLASVKVNGIDVTSNVSNNNYTISDIRENTTVVVAFETTPKYTLSITSSGGGNVAYSTFTISNTTNTYTFDEGASAALTFTPNSGYRIGSVKVNGTDVTSDVIDNKYTISNINQNTTVVVTFKSITYSLDITSSGGGYVVCANTTINGTTKSFIYDEGASATLTFTPNSGYRLASVKVNGINMTSNVSNNSYTISDVRENTTVVVTFETIPRYTLSITSSGGGDVTYSTYIISNTTKTYTFDEGTSATLTLTPNRGYRIGSVKVNGNDVTSDVVDNKYTISNIDQNTTVVVTFKTITYSLDITSSNGGYVTCANTTIIGTTKSFTYDEGASATLTFTPNSGYRLASLKVNGVDVTSKVSNNSYTLSDVRENSTVVVTFETIPRYTLSITSSGGGDVACSTYTISNTTKTYTFDEGASVTLTFTPNIGYKMESVIVNGYDVTSSIEDNKYTISNINQNSTVSVTFKAITYSLDITSSGGGYVTCANTTINGTTKSFTYDEGASTTLTFTPNSGYRLSSMKVNGIDVTSNVSNNSYILSEIRENTAVIVTFEAIPPTTYSLTITSLGYGRVYCAEEDIYNATKILTYDEGASAKLTLSPATGHRVKLLSINGIDVTSDIVDNQYTISNICNNTTINVAFEAIPPTTYSLTISSTGSGKVYYIGNIINGTTNSFTVNEGTTAVLTITPDKGCRIRMVKVNGTDVTSMVSEDLYTINNINQNTTVEVTFETIPSYILTITSSGTGFVVYSYYTVNNTTKSFTVEGSSSVTLTFNTIDGYRLESLIVNDEDVTSDVSENQYVIDNISRNTMVRVTFEKIPIIPTYSLTITSLSNGKVYCGEVEISNAAKIFSFDEGSSVELVLQPNNGYRLELLSVNGIDVTSDVEDNHYTISNISKNTTVTVAFEAIPPTTYTLSITSSGSGYVIYSGTTINNATESFTVNEGTSATLTFTPNTGYRIESLKVNGVDVSSYISDNKCIINDIRLNTTVSVTFEAIPQTTYTLTIASSDNGYVSYSGNTINSETNSFTIREGSSAFFVFTPHSGFQIGCLIVDGVDVTSSISDNNYTIGNIKQNTTVSVIFVEEQKEINVAKALEIINALADGETTSEKYQVKGFVVGALDFQRKADGSLYGNVNCTIADEQDSATLLTVFRAKNFGNENFTEETISTIKEGDEVVIEGQLQKYVKDGLYTPEIKNCYIVNIIKNNECTLTISSVGNGSVVYSDNNITGNTNSYSVNEGASASLTFTPNSGYRIGNVKVNGVDVTSSVLNNEYTIRNIKENTTVSVIFEKIPPMTYTLSITSSGGGDVTYSGNAINETTKSFTVNEGTSATFTFTPNSGYRLNSVKVNNVDVTSSVSNNTYTINSIGQNTTVSVEFVEELKSMTVDGVNYAVSSYDNRTVKVASGRYNNVLTVPATFTYQGMTWNVVGIDKGTLAGNTELAAIIWNPSVAFTESVSNPNLLLYVKAAQYAPSGIKNVVVNGAANSITLAEATSGNDFYCPQEFTAQQISYSHNYSMTTGVGECRGWETIALPFNVQTITHSTKGEIVPFAKWQEGDSRRPFWLYELTSSGWREASDIKAYTPYIISMPNNDLYYDEARLNGSITFSAQNTTIGVTGVETSTYGGRTFTPNFRNKTAGSNIYVLNVVNSLVTNKGGMTEGSQFIQDLRAVHPFEAYMTTTNNARASFGIFEDMTTSIRGITVLIDKERSKDIYNLKGQKMEAEKEGRLPAGVYIINGQKMMVK